jgi:hypothetical protein
MNRYFSLLLIAALVCVSGQCLADSNRVLLRPPDNYKGIDIGGVPYVTGQVYLPQLEDTVLLKPYGFRSFVQAGSAARYKKIKAWWPLNTDVDDLPDEVIGLTYEKLSGEDLAYAAIMTPETFPGGAKGANIRSLRFSGMVPKDGKPHLIYRDRPYVQGSIYCSSPPDEKALDSLGIIIYREMDNNLDDALYRDRHERWTAMWPMSLDDSQLPPYVVGMIADEPDYWSQGYDANGEPQTVYNNYYYGSSGGGTPFYGRGVNMTQRQQSLTARRVVEWTPAQRNNPNAYYYDTISRSTLTPTDIGAYEGNPTLRPNDFGNLWRYNYRYRRR